MIVPPSWIGASVTQCFFEAYQDAVGLAVVDSLAAHVSIVAALRTLFSFVSAAKILCWRLGGCTSMNRRTMPWRAAFSLLELLVALAVIGLLLGLLFPALSAARESARQQQCGNNLRQIGLALHGYHLAKQRLPVGCLEWRSVAGPPSRRQLAWSVFLLPYLEQQALYEALDLRQPYDAAVNAAAAKTRVASFECPSHPGHQTAPGRTDYGGLFGEIILDRRQDDGVFLHEQAIRYSQITDGLSHTLGIGEDLFGPDNGWINGRNVFVQARGVNDPTAWVGDNEIRGAHSKGALVLFCDGAARWLGQATDKQVLGQMITRDRGEVFE